VVDKRQGRCYYINILLNNARANAMTDYRDFAIELVEEMGYDPKDMLTAALKYMSMADVEDLLRVNEYPTPCEEDA
jgi:hypothetical protein